MHDKQNDKFRRIYSATLLHTPWRNIRRWNRGQGSTPRTQINPRTRPRTALPRTDRLEANDRNAPGQGQGSRTQTLVLSKKKVLQKNFSGNLQKKTVFQEIFHALHKLLTTLKIVLFSSRGQTNFEGLEASRPRPKTWPSRPKPRPRTSNCVLEDVLEAKNVLKDSTSGNIIVFHASPFC